MPKAHIPPTGPPQGQKGPYQLPSSYSPVILCFISNLCTQGMTSEQESSKFLYRKKINTQAPNALFNFQCIDVNTMLICHVYYKTYIHRNIIGWDTFEISHIYHYQLK